MVTDPTKMTLLVSAELDYNRSITDQITFVGIEMFFKHQTLEVFYRSLYKYE